MSMTRTDPYRPIPRVAMNAIREGDEARRPASKINVGQVERYASAIGGGVLVLHGLRRGNFGGLALALLGGGLIYRGTTGHCQAYQALDIDTAGKQRADESEQVWHGTLAKDVKTINAKPEAIYAFIKDPANYEAYFKDVKSVKAGPDGVWHWEMQGPFGAVIKFDSKLIADEAGHLIAWKSLPGGDVDNAGSIRIVPSKGGTGAEVTYEMNYHPPGGKLGVLGAKILGHDPAATLRENLRRIKQVMETGEVATTEGQPSGRA